MTDETTISEKIMLLKGIELFESLSVGELAAIASVVEEIDYPVGEIVITSYSIHYTKLYENPPKKHGAPSVGIFGAPHKPASARDAGTSTA